MSPWRSWLVVSGLCKVMLVLVTPWSDGRSTRATRARRRAAKAGSGSIGVRAVRSASNGSGMALREILLFRVGTAERRPCAHEERFGGVDGAVENAGDVSDRQVIEVPQCE